jgi:serine/threonine-protein kinase
LDDFRDQHLHQDPDPLNGASTLLTGLIDECLNKAPAARPRPTNVLARLSRVAAAPSSSGMVKLQQASRAEGARRSDASRQASIQQSEAERRQDLKRAAERSMQQIATAVSKTIDQAAPMANLSTGPSTGWTASLNQAELRLAPHSSTRAEPWGVSPAPAFEVVSHSTMSIQIPQNRYGYNGRSHALWFCDAQEAGRFQWFETAFMISPLVRQLNPQDPFALDPGEEASRALGPGPAYVQVAWPLTALTVGDLEEFISRWLGWFGDAAQGQLSRPTAMPERDPQGSWRRS